MWPVYVFLFLAGIDRCVWADCFWWGEVEAKLRETNTLSFRFRSLEDREKCMTAIDDKRRNTLYAHPADECTIECKARGKSNYIDSMVYKFKDSSMKSFCF